MAVPRKIKISQYVHADRRKNNPPVGLVNENNDQDERKQKYRYDPHLDPELRFDSKSFELEKLIDDAIGSNDKETMQSALEELKKLRQPYLNWAGKAEKTSFEVDTVSLHVHERIDTATILKSVEKKEEQPPPKSVQYKLFSQPVFDNLSLREEVAFYQHDRGWSNRLIAGDSLLVMNSLLQKESVAGKVQMIYMDPPYGIKYGSNFQPFVNKRDVKDGKDEDLTTEPEMIKAFRDTWELGIHSYLTYLRDRLLLSRELLTESGSIFVQISNENVHRVRCLMDEVFGVENFVSLISYRTRGMITSDYLHQLNDYIIWYAKEIKNLKFNRLYISKKISENTRYKWVELPPETRRTLSKEELNTSNQLPHGSKIFIPDKLSAMAFAESTFYEYEFEGNTYKPASGRSWQTSQQGMKNLEKAGRLFTPANTLCFIRYFNDYPVTELSNIWQDVQGELNKNYAVQTSSKVIQRCILMTTDPGDLIFDPTCGSGTTAYVAEKWGRRWITCDTSRVATTLAKQRLMTAGFDYYTLRYPDEGVKSGFEYKTVPHITLKSIANNPEIDEIYESENPKIERALKALNKSAKKNWREWEVPFESEKTWSDKIKRDFETFHKTRQAMQKKMNESIAVNASQEILYDQPKINKKKYRIAGPFTVEAVPFATVLALEQAKNSDSADLSIARSGETIRQNDWKDELLKNGIRGKGGQMIEFSEISTIAGTRYLHAEGFDKANGSKILISFGPEFAPMEQRQVALALNEAEKMRPSPAMIVFAAFSFDPEASKDIDETSWPGVMLLKVQMNADLFTEDLKKKRTTNESFWLIGQPDVELIKNKVKYQIEVNGFDYYDVKKGEIISGGKKNIAMWMLDTDYDERSLLPTQVFFPMAGVREGWNRLSKTLKAYVDKEKINAFCGTRSLEFEAGPNRRVAVKIIDDRGIESLKIVELDQ